MWTSNPLKMHLSRREIERLERAPQFLRSPPFLRNPLLREQLLQRPPSRFLSWRHFGFDADQFELEGGFGALFKYIALFFVGMASVVVFYGFLIVVAAAFATDSSTVAAGGAPQTALIWATGGMLLIGTVQLLRFALSELPMLISTYCGEHRRLVGLSMVAVAALAFLLF